MEWNKKSELSYNALRSMFCHGGTDINGEWIPSVGYNYDYINNWIYNINHNYQVQIYKRKKNKWHLSIYLCLTACNSNEVKLFDNYYTTLKEAKKITIDFLKEYDISNKAWIDINQWKMRYSKPVFQIKDSEVTLIGTTYNTVGNDRNSDNYFTYYNEDIPAYSYGDYYELNEGRDKIYIWKVNLFGSGYSASGVKDENLLNKMSDIIKYIPKYKHFIDFMNEKRL